MVVVVAAIELSRAPHIGGAHMDGEETTHPKRRISERQAGVLKHKDRQC
jgi:hypothetical protein